MSSLIFVVAMAAQTASSTTVSQPSPAPPPATTSGQSTARGTTTYVDLEAGAGYSTNPALSIINAKGAAFGRLAAHAVHTRISERTTTVLTGFAQGQFYSNGQSSQKTFDLSARHDARVTEKLRIFGDASLGYDEGGQFDNRVFVPPVVPLPPGSIQS